LNLVYNYFTEGGDEEDGKREAARREDLEERRAYKEIKARFARQPAPELAEHKHRFLELVSALC
jgi:hypothetical protein